LAAPLYAFIHFSANTVQMLYHRMIHVYIYDRLMYSRSSADI